MILINNLFYVLLPTHHQFSSFQLLSRVWLFATPWIAARQASLSITNSRSSLRVTSIESVMPSSHLILCHPFLLLPPIPPSIRVFKAEEHASPSQPILLLFPMNPDKSVVIKSWFVGSITWAHSSPLLPATCVISGRLLNLPESHLYPCKKRIKPPTP